MSNHKVKTVTPGHYKTAEGSIAIITHIIGTRAHGHLMDCRDTTWWQVDNGQHGLYLEDDLVERLPSS